MDKKSHAHQTVFAALCLLLLTGDPAMVLAAPPELFPQPPSLLPSVTFWKGVYTTYGVGDFLLHDRERLRLVYEVVQVEEHRNPGRAAKLAEPAIRRLRAKYQGILTNLANGIPPEQLGEDGVRVAEDWGCPCQPALLRKAAGNIRVQQGLKETVAEGLERARVLLPRVLPILQKHDLPVELAAIPMVESTWNAKARSKVAAVGLWQFMRSTGRRYLKITRRQDERRDPLRATEGAAHLLRDNYAELGSWPLAIVAYNHGAGGMQRAQRQIGSQAIEEILANYAGPRFGFASKNFYPEFLAALEVLQPLLPGYPQPRGGERLRPTPDTMTAPVVAAPAPEPMISTPPPNLETAPEAEPEPRDPETPPTTEPSL
jgi:membrane-bound lytic murein transglycosylase D